MLGIKPTNQFDLSYLNLLKYFTNDIEQSQCRVALLNGQTEVSKKLIFFPCEKGSWVSSKTNRKNGVHIGQVLKTNMD